MPQRLVKRNASLCVSLALIWLFLCLLATALQNASPSTSWIFLCIIWGIQLLLIAGAIYFYKTEKPTLMYWVGDVQSYASTVVSIDILPEILHKLTLLIPELTKTNIQNIMAEMQKEPDENGVTIPITFYNRPEELPIYSSDEEKYLKEHFEENKIGLFVNSC